MLWFSEEKGHIEIKEMETKHLCLCARMLWNHYTPNELRLFPYKFYVDLKKSMSEETAVDFLEEMLKELKTREDVSKGWKVQLEYIENEIQDMFYEPELEKNETLDG